MNENKELIKAIGDAARRIKIGLRDVAAELRRMNTREDERVSRTHDGQDPEEDKRIRAFAVDITEEEYATVQALETCTGTNCGICKYLGTEQCYDKLIRDAHSLILRILLRDDTSSGAPRHLPLEGKAELSEEDRKTVETLEACTAEGCGECPLCEEVDCVHKSQKDGLDLIRRLLAERGVKI